MKSFLAISSLGLVFVAGASGGPPVVQDAWKFAEAFATAKKTFAPMCPDYAW